MFQATNLMIKGPAGALSVRTKALAQAKQAVVLVQGANMSGQMGYDFSYPGSSDYSMMDAFATGGFGVVTFAVRGYEKSEIPADPFSVQTEQAIEDLAAVVNWVHDQGFARPHLLGWSWGGRITGRYAEKHAAMIDRLVMLDPAIGGGDKILPQPTDCWWLNTHEYFFNRLEHQYMDLEALNALGQRMEAEEPRSPNGIRMENFHGSVAVVPSLVTCPTMMLYGAAAGQQNYMQGGWDRLEFFKQLATDDKSFVIVPGGGDYAHLQHPRKRIYSTVLEFLHTATLR